MRRPLSAAVALGGLMSGLLGGADSETSAIKKDVQLRAMSDELARTKTLQLNNLDKPCLLYTSRCV